VRTGLRSIGRINECKRNTGERAFVGGERPELSKGPVVVPRALPATEPCSPVDAFQVLEGDPTVCVFRGLDKGLAYAVVHIALKAALAARQLFEPALCGLGSYSLERGAAVFVPLAVGLDGIAREDATVAVHGDVDYSEIDAQPTGRVEFWRFGDLTDLMQIPFTVSKDQVGLALPVLKQLDLSFTGKERHLLSPRGRPDTGGLGRHLPGQDTLVIGDSAVLHEGTLVFLVQLVGVCYFGFHSDGELGRESKPFTHVVVDELVKAELPEGLGVPSALANVVASGVGFFQCIEQGLGLLLSWLELDLCYQFHHSTLENIIARMFGGCQIRSERRRHFLSPINWGVSMPKIL